MRNKIILLSVSILLFNCTTQKYIVTSELNAKEQSINSEILYIPISFIDRQNSTILNEACDRINKLDYQGLEEAINSLDSKIASGADVFLSKALLNISRGHYLRANDNLKKNS